MFSMLAFLMMMSEQPIPPVQAGSAAFYIATYIDVQVSSTNEGMGLIKQYRDATRAEKGNSGADFVQEMGRPSRFVIVEFWKDQASFDAHEKAGHTAQFRSKLKAIHNSPYDQRVHQGLAVDPRPLAARRGRRAWGSRRGLGPPKKKSKQGFNKGPGEGRRETSRKPALKLTLP